MGHISKNGTPPEDLGHLLSSHLGFHFTETPARGDAEQVRRRAYSQAWLERGTERLFSRLDELVGPAEPPARLQLHPLLLHLALFGESYAGQVRACL